MTHAAAGPGCSACDNPTACRAHAGETTPISVQKVAPLLDRSDE